MFRRYPKIAASCIGLSVITLAVWGSFSYLRGQDKDDKPKPKDKVEVIETRGETTKTPRAGVKEEKNDPKNPEVTKRASPVSCDIHFDNRSRWVIHRMWVDGRLRARNMQPWGDIYIRDVSTGPTELYAEADFTDGTTSRWGPASVSCRSYQTFSWKLTSSR